MKKICAMLFPFSKRAKENLWFLLSLFLYLVIWVVFVVIGLILMQWVPVVSYLLIAVASVYALGGIVYSIYTNLQTLK